MAKSVLTPLLIAITMGTLLAQSGKCFEKFSGPFWPIEVGIRIDYASTNETFYSFFNGDSLKVGDHYFLKEVREYSTGRKLTRYWREDNGVVYFFDPQNETVSIELINDLAAGNSWEKYDQTWKYTIVDTVSTITTPYCQFSNLLQVKAEPQNELKESNTSVYNLFYKRGVGLVAMKVNGVLSFFATPPRKPNERSFTAYGCEEIESPDERRNCTYQKILEFLLKEIKPPRKEDMKRGRIVFEVLLGLDGLVKSVKVVETIEGAEKQEMEAIRAIKKLPKMIPAQVDDGKPISSIFRIPLNF